MNIVRVTLEWAMYFGTVVGRETLINVIGAGLIDKVADMSSFCIILYNLHCTSTQLVPTVLHSKLGRVILRY